MHDHPGPDPLRALQADRPAEALGEPAHQGEPYPVPGRRPRLSAREGFEDAVDRLRGHARPVVLDAQKARLRPHPHPYGPAPGVEAGVAQQVADQHREHLARRPDHQPAGLLDDDFDRLALDEVPDSLHLLADDVVHAYRLRGKATVRLAGQQQEDLGQLLHVRGGALDPHHRISRRPGELLLAQQHVRRQPDDGQGAAQLVARVAGEAVLAFGEGVEAVAEAAQCVREGDDLLVGVRGQAIRTERARVG